MGESVFLQDLNLTVSVILCCKCSPPKFLILSDLARFSLHMRVVCMPYDILTLSMLTCSSTRFVTAWVHLTLITDGQAVDAFLPRFWGSGAIQLYFYYEVRQIALTLLWFYADILKKNTAKSDRWWIKLGVSLIWLLDTAHEVIVAHLVYTIFVKNFSNISYLNHYGT